ncbi:MAG: DNA gyrase inhibitor YacG [Neisseriaceae bacterium]|nr:DNA gyrase inhibitor YacG [Neisseriaceae bacterium]
MLCSEAVNMQVKCPTCGKLIEWQPENRFRPFCSERCKMRDLGAWAEEKYAITETSEPMSGDLNSSTPNSL